MEKRRLVSAGNLKCGKKKCVRNEETLKWRKRRRVMKENRR